MSQLLLRYQTESSQESELLLAGENLSSISHTTVEFFAKTSHIYFTNDCLTLRINKLVAHPRTLHESLIVLYHCIMLLLYFCREVVVNIRMLVPPIL